MKIMSGLEPVFISSLYLTGYFCPPYPCLCSLNVDNMQGNLWCVLNMFVRVVVVKNYLLSLLPHLAFLCTCHRLVEWTVTAYVIGGQ